MAAASWRWIEVDRWDVPVHCGQSEWAAKLARRPELAVHEEAIRATVREPDALFFDEYGTERRRALGRPLGIIMHYISAGRGQGAFAGKFICVVVKWTTNPGRTEVTGYVSTVYLADDLQPRLRLVWDHEP